MRHRAILLPALPAFVAASKRLRKKESFLAALMGFVTGKWANPKAIPSYAMTPQWFREHEVKADIDSGMFPDKCALQEMPMSLWEEAAYMCVALAFLGIFFWLPGLLLLSLLLLPARTAVVGTAAAAAAVFLSTKYLPWQCWPAMEMPRLWQLVAKYYSYRVVVEAPCEAYAGPCIFAMGPHGVVPLGPAIQAMLNSYIPGTHCHMLAASVVFSVPFYNVWLKLAAYRSVAKEVFKATLLQGRSVGG